MREAQANDDTSVRDAPYGNRSSFRPLGHQSPVGWSIPRSPTELLTIEDLPSLRGDAEREANRTRVPGQRSWPCGVLNLCVAAIGLALTAPLLLASAIAIKLTSGGPVFYRQFRVGLDRRNGGRPAAACRRQKDFGGKPFRILKLRTMYVDWEPIDAEITKGQVWTQPNDPRITPIGRWLRRTRIDELPQLLNVLLGQMSVVGPRPEQPEIFRVLRERIDGYQTRQSVKPGITGLAQVNLAYDRTIADVKKKLAYDLSYIRNRSMRHDLEIMARTLPVILKRTGAL